MRARGSLLKTVFVAFGLVAVGCSSAASPTPPAVASTPAAVAAASTTPAPAASSPSPVSGGSATVATGSSATLGTFLTGAAGMTLYVRTSDPASGSSCTGGCAGAWPPFTVAAGATPAASGAVTGTFGTFARADGTMQVTYDGRALYYYAADAAAGDTTGQGVGGVWFVALVGGNTAGGGVTTPATPAPSKSPSGGPSY